MRTDPRTTDPRNIEHGLSIPRENYCDQPYIVECDSGAWLCVLTTGPGLESRDGQHVVSTRSTDYGESWSDLVDIEPSGDRRSSWVTVCKVSGGRVYAIYNYDHDGESTQHGGWLMYRYSDDEGMTWSHEAFRIPLRQTRQDRENVSGGSHQYFWCIDKPVISNGVLYFGIPKLASGLPLDGGESWVVSSDNIDTEEDPKMIRWSLLPDGDVGISAPELGSVQEEQNVEVLQDGSLYLAMRTAIGHPAYTLSHDRGLTWSKPRFMAYRDGRPMKNPRACPRVWRGSNGRFLFWFHNNGFPGWGELGPRNPVWISGGIERHGDIDWSEPEVLLYSTDPTIVGMSYPDFVEQDGRIWVSETQKSDAYVHEIPAEILRAVWEREACPAPEAAVVDSSGPAPPGAVYDLPPIPPLDSGGFSIELWLRIDDARPDDVIITSVGTRGIGCTVRVGENGSLELELLDGKSRFWREAEDNAEPIRTVRGVRSWRLGTGPLAERLMHHVVFNIDGQAGIASAVVDGVLWDGGAESIRGWKRLNPNVRNLNAEGRLFVGEFEGHIERLRVYDRGLLTNQSVRLHHDLANLIVQPPRIVTDPGDMYRDEERAFQGIPTIERADNGRLWAAWYGGGEGEDRHNCVFLATASDGAWSPPTMVIEPGETSPTRAFDPCLWRDPSGRLWLFWSQGYHHHSDRRWGVWSMVTESPDDDRPQWDEPRRLCDGIMMNKPTVTADGVWLLPVAEWWTEQSAGVYASNDNGVTFSYHGGASVPEGSRNCDEHMIVERPVVGTGTGDRELLMLTRTGYGIGESVSRDGGRSWSEVTTSPIGHTTSRFCIRRLSSGSVLLVKHGPVDKRTDRRDLTAYVSHDDGKNWEGGLMIDSRIGVSYPDAVEAPDGTIYLIYDFDRRYEKEIRLVRFTEDDIRTGHDVTAEIVNKATG